MTGSLNTYLLMYVCIFAQNKSKNAHMRNGWILFFKNTMNILAVFAFLNLNKEIVWIKFYDEFFSSFYFQVVFSTIFSSGHCFLKIKINKIIFNCKYQLLKNRKERFGGLKSHFRSVILKLSAGIFKLILDKFTVFQDISILKKFNSLDILFVNNNYFKPACCNDSFMRDSW